MYKIDFLDNDEDEKQVANIFSVSIGENDIVSIPIGNVFYTGASEYLKVSKIPDSDRIQLIRATTINGKERVVDTRRVGAGCFFGVFYQKTLLDETVTYRWEEEVVADTYLLSSGNEVYVGRYVSHNTLYKNDCSKVIDAAGGETLVFHKNGAILFNIESLEVVAFTLPKPYWSYITQPSYEEALNSLVDTMDNMLAIAVANRRADEEAKASLNNQNTNENEGGKDR